MRSVLCKRGFSCSQAFLFLIHVMANQVIHAEGWPTYRHDNRRSGVTTEALDFPLERLWVWRSTQPPRTAWSGPAKWDAYTGNRDLQSMRNFDPCYFVTADDDKVFFGSSSDDAVHALDAETGEESWVRIVGAPVRLPPTIDGDRVLFGADDGNAYCLRKDSGEKVWSMRASDSKRHIFNDRRLISMWPIRTGVLVEDGLATFAGSLVPWEDSHLVTVDAATGESDVTGCFRQKVKAVTLQGALLASKQNLYVPQGRAAPLAFKKLDGVPLGSVGEAGGVFCILTEDEMLLAGPNHQKETDRQIRVTNLSGKRPLASFAGTNRILVEGAEAWLSVGKELKKLDRSEYLEAQLEMDQAAASVKKDEQPSEEVKEKIKQAKSRQQKAWSWKIECDPPLDMVKAGPSLLLGFQGEVRAYSGETGELIWWQPIDGTAHGIAVANGRMFVSTDRGVIYAFGSLPQ